MYVATSRQMKAYDQLLLDEGYTIEELVDKASNALLTNCMNYQSYVIICGPGNNGADGISLGIKLHVRNREVKLYCIGDEDKLSKANKFFVEQAYNEGMNVTFMHDELVDSFKDDLDNCEVVIDAMFGFGLNSPIRGIGISIIQEINSLDKDIISIDIPTGLNPDTGIPYGNVVCATKTITLTALKQAFLNDECHLYTGEIILETLDTKDYRPSMGLAQLVSPSWVKFHLKPRSYYGHKGDYGKVLHITGCDHYRGAAMLASKASVYAGSGIVCVCSTDKVIDAIASNIPECTFSLRQETLSPNVFKDKDAILLGSGLGLNTVSEGYVLDTLKYATCPIVIDADALTIISHHLDELKQCDVPVILTPHFGEFKRLVDYEDELDMVEKAMWFAEEYNVILVLKGPNTIISDGSEMYRNITANKAMATAGMGDALAGIITSFVGQGYSVKNAAILGTYIHGSCGDVLASNNYTVLPSKLITMIPKMMLSIIDDNNV